MLKRVLIFTNSADATADHLCIHLENAGIQPVRYNTDTDVLCTRFTYGGDVPKISWRDYHLQPDQICAVILRRPKPLNPSVEGDPFRTKHLEREWAEVWEGFFAHIPESCWINHPAQNFKASHKIEQLTRAKRFGFKIPATLVTNEPEQAKQFVACQTKGTVVKPLASGYIERSDPSNDTIIYTRKFAEEHHFLLDVIEMCPIMFQQRIEKQIDVRMTVLDDQIVAVGLTALDEKGQQRLDIRRNNMTDLSYKFIEVPDIISVRVKSLLKSYGLRFAALDFAIMTDASWVFFEINPNGQWAWLDLDAETDIAGFFANTLLDAMAEEK